MFGIDDALIAAAAAEAAAASAAAAAPAVIAAPLAGEAAAAAAGATMAPTAVAPMTGMTAPTGFASILNPLNAAPGVGQVGSGMTGAANPFAAVGNLSTAAPSLPMGMTPGPLPGAAGPGSGLSGTGTFAEMPGAAGGLDAGPLAKNAAALKPEQLAQLSRLMPGQQGQAVGGSGRGGARSGSGNVVAAGQLTAPSLGTARPSLGAILGLRGAR